LRINKLKSIKLTARKIERELVLTHIPFILSYKCLGVDVYLATAIFVFNFALLSRLSMTN